ncbi:hypothetical protein CEXT_567111 [Caerostris extrusa]|uniref:Uncharacterized protein n=1 Tax=Caerostris extrusa TaxID=172846 RepID=A0AAV4N9S5_CAEEX|nr:hypothetical protein CEXT_567111 [Caerostris extrusa]
MKAEGQFESVTSVPSLKFVEQHKDLIVNNWKKLSGSINHADRCGDERKAIARSITQNWVICRLPKWGRGAAKVERTIGTPL